MTTPATFDPTLVEAVDGLIAHAVEWAGARLVLSVPRRDRYKAKRLPPAQVHQHISVQEHHLGRALDGAFDRVPTVARRFGLDVMCLRQTVESYVRDLLTAGQPHSYEFVPSLLRTASCLQPEAVPK